jgi:hypothetical protein
MLRSPLTIKTFRSARPWLVASLALAALMVAVPVHAGPIQFANFNLLNANEPFSWTNNGNSGTMSVPAVPATQVTFDFTAQSGLPTTDHFGTLTINPGGAVSTITPATGPPSPLDNQPIGNSTVLTITENGTGKNLLTMTFTGNMYGTDGGPNATVSGASPNVTFSSDFGSFNSTGNSYILGLDTLLTPGTLVPTTFTIGPGGFINSFLANINGQFVANFTAVPAPTSAVMYGTGLAVSMIVAHRVRRKRLARS